MAGVVDNGELISGERFFSEYIYEVEFHDFDNLVGEPRAVSQTIPT